MSAWIPVITQALPLILPAIGPFIMKGINWLLGLLGGAIPASVAPAVNAIIGGVISYATGSDPTLGAITAHVVRSGLEHEAPVTAAPAATAAGKDATQGA